MAAPGAREEYLREVIAQGLAAAPEIARVGPARTSHQGEVYETQFRYVYERVFPFMPAQVAQELIRAVVASRGLWQTPRLQVLLKMNEGFRRKNHLVFSHVFSVGHGDTAGLAEDPPPGSAWQRIWGEVVEALTREDRYDVEEAIDFESAGGPGEDLCRMADVTLLVREHRAPAGGCLGGQGSLCRTVVDLPTADGLCGQGCLAYHGKNDKDRANMRDRKRKTATNCALKVAAEIGVHGAMSLNDFAGYAAAHPGLRIVILNRAAAVLLDTGVRCAAPDNVYLQLAAGHYSYIPNIQRHIRDTPQQQRHWCHSCLKAFMGREEKKHLCSRERCSSCARIFLSEADKAAHLVPTPERCPRCRERFVFEGCVAGHKCVYTSCKDCGMGMELRGVAVHRCGLQYCRYCEDYTPQGRKHRCHITPLKPFEVKGTPCYALDLESTIDEAGQHEIALGVVVRVLLEGPHPEAAGAGGGGGFAEAPSPVHLDGAAGVVKWLDDNSSEGGILVAHNGGAYDWVLIHAALLKRGGEPRDHVYDGEKILSMRYRKFHFIDSRRHLAGSLSSLVATFALEGLSKGWFPYRFFTPANLHYVGDVPPLEWFEPRTAGDPAFREWHASVPPGGYDIYAECRRYCEADTVILARALEAYRRSAIDTCGLDPLTAVTIAGYALKVYRTRFMPRGALPVLSPAEQEFLAPALKGGRTDALQLERHWSAADVAAGRYACYVDVNSLYPTVQYCDPLPGEVVSPPEEFAPPLEGAAALEFVAGLAAAGRLAVLDYDITPPPDLHIPVLLTRSAEGRLLAGLLPIARGRDTSVEIQEALAAGYTGLVVHGAMVFEARKDLFRDYVGAYLAQKERHSPGGADPNPGKRAVAKLMLNSLWGKLAQKARPTSWAYVYELKQWYSLVRQYHRRELNISIVACGPCGAGSEGWTLVERANIDNPATLARKTNIAVAAFITSRARLRLYSELARLGERVLYHDTDSIIYERDPAGYNVPVGEGLGEWKDETSGDPITSVVCLGPKTYAYRTARGDSTAKCKGFPVTWGTLEMYQKILAASLDARQPVTERCRYPRFVLSTKSSAPGVRTVEDSRALQFEYIKRLVVHRGLTRPVGWGGAPVREPAPSAPPAPPAPGPSALPAPAAAGEDAEVEAFLRELALALAPV